MNEKNVIMNHTLLQLMNSHKFYGKKTLHTYLNTFYELCGSVRIIGENEQELFFRLFPFYLNRKVKTWFQS